MILGCCSSRSWRCRLHLGRIAVRPGAFDQSLAGMGIPGFGHRPLLAPLPGGVFRGDQAQKFHAVLLGYRTRVRSPSAATMVTATVHWHAAQGLEGFDHRVEAPALPVLLACVFETLEAFGVFGDGTDICLKDDGLRRCRADALPRATGDGPGSSWPGRGADIVSEQEGLQTKLGVFEITEGIFTGPGEVAHGFVFDLGDIDRGEITRASQAGQLHGVPAVGFDAVTGFFGNAVRGPRPSRRRLFSSDSDRARSHTGRLHRRR